MRPGSGMCQLPLVQPTLRRDTMVENLANGCRWSMVLTRGCVQVYRRASLIVARRNSRRQRVVCSSSSERRNGLKHRFESAAQLYSRDVVSVRARASE